ncbi:MAG: pantoate--beta-alanine [Prolixibacteraceae bacterium]|nr:MAG: pantoate--beta-alanine [Prolixibacteraceae bacterium]
MFLIETIKGLKNKLNELKETGTTGFVPTMGALHDGHISLVRQAVSENKTVVVSIFVNPTQFNDPKDLERYPRNLNADLGLLEKTGCQIVFAPTPEEIYPGPDTRRFNFGALETIMEGKHRPGHFNGVAQIVSKFFDIVQPGKAYFGLKDFQQLAIIKEMVSQLKLPVEIVPCPIVREKNGLAMSSRNELLSAEERINAAVISKTLFEANKPFEQKSVRELAEWISETINKNPYLTVEYVEIVDNRQLQPVKSWDDEGEKVCCVAVFCGKVRLIDNVVLTKKTK